MLPAFDYQDDSKFENQVLKAFKEQYPDIELELITASIDNWMVKLRTSASSGEAIDVFQDSANNNPMYALRGINQPLQDYIDMNNPNLHKETMDTVFCYNGNYYVAVTEPDPCVLFYNKEIFESEGLETPEELYQAGDWNFDSLAALPSSSPTATTAANAGASPAIILISSSGRMPPPWSSSIKTINTP